MKEKIINTFERYAHEDIDLAISLTARALNLDEATVRFILE